MGVVLLPGRDLAAFLGGPLPGLLVGGRQALAVEGCELGLHPAGGVAGRSWVFERAYGVV